MERYKILFLVLLFLSYQNAKAELIINEIMYNCPGADKGYEWIELFNNGNSSFNISGYKLYENEVHHELNLVNGSLVIEAYSYAIIADNPFLFLSEYQSYSETLIESSFSLHNSGESLIIRGANLTIVDNVTYDSSWGGAGNNKSLERINENRWGESIVNKGTPGQQNSLFDSCDWSISIITDKELFELQDKLTIKWKIEVKESSDKGSINFSYWIEDYFGNLVKSVTEKTANTSDVFGYYQKTFDEPGGYVILANITDIDCKDSNDLNNLVSKVIVIKGKEKDREGSEQEEQEEHVKQEQSSYISILDVSSDADNSIITAEINVYKGNTDKYALDAYVEDDKGERLSEKTKLHLKTKYTNYTLMIPVNIKPNCEQSFKDNEYSLIVKGFGLKEEEELTIEEIGSLCSEATNENELLLGRFGYEILDYPDEIEAGEEFEVRVRLKNNENKQHNITIWSYVYRGSKCYSGSGNREENKRRLILPKNNEVIATLKNKVAEAMPGDYKLKLLILMDNRKNPYEIIKNISITDKIPSSQGSYNQTTNLEFGDNLKAKELEDIDDIQPRVSFSEQSSGNSVIVYENVGSKANNLVPYLMIFISLVFNVILVWRR